MRLAKFINRLFYFEDLLYKDTQNILILQLFLSMMRANNFKRLYFRNQKYILINSLSF